MRVVCTHLYMGGGGDWGAEPSLPSLPAQYKMDGSYSDIVQLTIWAADASEFSNVTIMFSDSSVVGSGIAVATGLSISSANQRLTVNCSAVTGTSVEYLTLESWNAGSKYLSVGEIMVLRSGESLRV